jgi:8-oxo-dGTP diphosphatase/2-hydroxy-dATP diphosphatase
MKKVLTLTLVCREGSILLGMKKRGFGAGRYNGFGGKVEPGESIEEAARRELLEESGLIADSILPYGVLNFSFENEEKVLEVHIFKVEDYSGKETETEEMTVEWFPYADIPYNKMWPDDQYWLPYLLNGKKFKGEFIFDRPSDENYTSKIISSNLEEMI